jgi:hypothetical protein
MRPGGKGLPGVRLSEVSRPLLNALTIRVGIVNL